METKLNHLGISNRISFYNYLFIGASTGGFPIVKDIVTTINPEKTTVIINQHISESFSDNMYETIENSTQSTFVHIVRGNCDLLPGHIYLLKGGSDYKIFSGIEAVKILCSNDHLSQYHPSFNHLLSDVDSLDGNLGIIVLSGLGNDGRASIDKLRMNACEVVVQDPKTAVAPGMPQEAIATNRVSKILL